MTAEYRPFRNTFAALENSPPGLPRRLARHDIGKYSAAFQQRVRGSAVSVDHSTAGAQEARNRGDLPAALAIAGHHGGIPDCGNLNDAADDTTLQGRLKRKLPTYDEWQREIAPPSAKPPAWALSDSTTAAFYTRMLYSCLVDADFQDTQNFMDGQAAPRGGGESISELLEKVRAKAKGYLANPESPVASQRNAALRACMERGAQWERGSFVYFWREANWMLDVWIWDSARKTASSIRSATGTELQRMGFLDE